MMGRRVHTYPTTWHHGDDEPYVVLSSGPQRVETTEHDPTFVARPVGFAPPISDVQEPPADEEPVDMPDLWEGDQA